MKEEYIEKTIEIMRQLDDVEMLKKVYTMAKTLLSIWQEKQASLQIKSQAEICEL